MVQRAALRPYAITFLRNKGDAYTLQMLLGHSTMEMVKIYLQLAQSDVDQASGGYHRDEVGVQDGGPR